jgi:signal transduction histidine kinase
MDHKPSLFALEEATIEAAEKRLDAGGSKGKLPSAFYGELLEQYSKLLRQSKSLVRTGDLMQGEVRALNLKLETSERKYRSMMEAIEDPLYVSSSDYTLEYLNPSMVERIGHDATGSPCYESIHGREGKCPWCPDIRSDISDRLEILSPGDQRSYCMAMFPLENQDASVSRMGILRDTTDLRRMEDEVSKMVKLESVGVMAGGIAHDFNNLLAVIMGNLEIARDDMALNLLPLSNLDQALKACDKVRRLTKEFITMARKSAPSSKPEDIRSVIEDVAQRLAEGSVVTRAISFAENLQKVSVDQGLMRRALNNLILNALEAMPLGGVLGIVAENVLVKEKRKDLPVTLKPGPYVLVAISDTGSGIEAENMDRVFDPYFSTKEQGTQKGMGLGLSTALSIINSHGGALTLDSEPGKGTTVRIYLPAWDRKGDVNVR